MMSTNKMIGTMCHPSDSEAWKHFNHARHSFYYESRNVSGIVYRWFSTIWSIQTTIFIMTSNNYSIQFATMAVHEGSLYVLILITPGPNNPKNKVDAFLQSLIAELKHLWDVGVQTYAVSWKQNFQMRVALMWTIGHFPCVLDAFWLEYSWKTCLFLLYGAFTSVYIVHWSENVLV